MFELFKRIKTVVSSELHGIVDRAENPVLMVEEFLRQMNQEIVDGEKATAKMMAEEKLLVHKISQANELVEKRQQQAIEALKSNREDLAKRALEDKGRLLDEVAQLQALHAKTTEHVEDLKQKLSVMRAEFREMELKRDTLKSRAEAADSRAKLNRSLGVSQTTSAKKGFERMEEKVMRKEAEAEASEDFLVDSKTLEQELDELDSNTAVLNELEELKKQLKNEA
ncbi:hypothetical protein Q75_01275 [Bacillus coahuilensis p1.1.43]|uniref:Phage-shock protein n=1 Tax=Bacillus coahuilensis p1.1.43 TaxID=1150625 RepID=A0A147KC54_9BACI|nr:PspA/IM30 family protein [Bacillus coahuilensis]KUP09101.1 hypothetical protein Q75_01275 [Bacillus coahuilensis p1.1.43]